MLDLIKGLNSRFTVIKPSNAQSIKRSAVWPTCEGPLKWEQLATIGFKRNVCFKFRSPFRVSKSRSFPSACNRNVIFKKLPGCQIGSMTLHVKVLRVSRLNHPTQDILHKQDRSNKVQSWCGSWHSSEKAEALLQSARMTYIAPITLTAKPDEDPR